MKKLVLTLPIVLFVFICCDMSKDESNKVVRPMNHQSDISESELKKAVIYNGSTSAYDELSTAYLDYLFEEEFLFYAMIMANKYDYPQAYFDVYFYLTQTFSTDIGNIDDKSAKMAIEYLLKAYEKGHHQAKDIVEEYSINSSENNKLQIVRIFKE